MVKTRIQNWLMEHPEVLSFVFLIALKWEEYVPGDIIIQGGSSSAQGP